MLQRTKKFFKEQGIPTRQVITFSEGYEKLPKNPSYNGHHNNGRFSLENIYTEFVDHQREPKDHIMAITYENNTKNSKNSKPSMLINQQKVRRKNQLIHEETSSEIEEKRRCVTKKLKELESLDRDNVDHVYDIQEIVRCYSMLTCPVYREMVETFFMEMYSEVFSVRRPDNTTPRRLSTHV
ncbi:hypothetical protein Tco_1354739 [Tanacetum coccineum]